MNCGNGFQGGPSVLEPLCPADISPEREFGLEEEPLCPSGISPEGERYGTALMAGLCGQSEERPLCQLPSQGGGVGPCRPDPSRLG